MVCIYFWKGNDNLWRCTLGVHLFLQQKQVRSHAHLMYALLLPSFCVRCGNCICGVLLSSFPLVLLMLSYWTIFTLVFIRLSHSFKAWRIMYNNIIMILVLYQKNMFMHCNPASKPSPIQWNPSLQTPLK